MDTWTWNSIANEGLEEIISNKNGVFTKQSIHLILGLEKVLGKGSLFAYLVSMTQRIAEIYRVLKPTGSFYLHCDPTASHYLKLVCDCVFCPKGGDYKNEIIWIYRERELSKKHWNKKHDVIFFYTKSSKYSFNPMELLEEYSAGTIKKFNYTDENGRKFQIRGKSGIYTGKQGLKIELETTHPVDYYNDKNEQDFKQVIFSVKSNKTLSPTVIRDLFGTVEREKAVMGFLLTLYPMPNLVKEAEKYGNYRNEMFGHTYPKITVVSVQDILEGKKMYLPTSVEVLKKAERKKQEGIARDIFEN